MSSQLARNGSINNIDHTNFQDLERKIEQRAQRQVQNMLQRADNLEKIDQLTETIERKKANREARLKTAVQSQLGGVKSGLEQLKLAKEDCAKMQNSMRQVDSFFENCMELGDWVQDMKDLSQEHSQLSAAMDNLRQLFKTPELTSESLRYIENENYLEAHNVLTELEFSRDDLLFELHKNPNRSSADESMIIQYFQAVERIKLDNLHAAITRELDKMFTTVRSNPSKFVAALRVIEREEYLDKQFQERCKHSQSNSKFNSCNRPYEWRRKALEQFHDMIDSRVDPGISGPSDQNQGPGGRNPSNESGGSATGRAATTRDSKWIVTSLETVRTSVLQDLQIIKQLCVPCFPPIYNIFERFTHWYHMAVSTYVRTILSHGLEGNEIVALLTFDKEYTSEKLMAHPVLKIDVNKLPQLIDHDLYEETLGTYIETTKEKFRTYLLRLLNQEKEDWYSDQQPEFDADQYYCTTLPTSLKKLIVDTMKVAEQVDDDVASKIFEKVKLEIEHFTEDIKNAVEELVADHGKDRNVPPSYLNYMIAISNNCQVITSRVKRLVEMFGDGEDDQPRTSNLSGNNPFGNPDGEGGADGHGKDNYSPEYLNFFDYKGQIGLNLSILARYIIDQLLNEVFLDLKTFFDSLLTENEWLKADDGYGPVETITATIEDYAQDFQNMRTVQFTSLIKECERRLAIDYIKAIFAKKMKISDAATLVEVAQKIDREADTLERFVALLLSQHDEGGGDENNNFAQPWEVKPMEAVKLCGSILQSSSDMLELEIQGLASRFSDVTTEHVRKLLDIRGDLSKDQIGEKLAIVEEAKNKICEEDFSNHNIPKIFAEITVSTGAFGGLW